MNAKVVWGVILCGLATGCTTVLYDGPRRPSGEVARVVVERGTTIVNVDARPVSGAGSSVYEVLPGPHQVAATLSDIDTREPQLRQASPGGASTCFEAKAASVYTVSTMVQDWRLWTRVFDRESGENVDSACVVRTASGVTLARKQEPAERPPTRAPSAADNDNSPMRSWGGFRLGVGYSSGGADLLNGDGGEPLPAGAGSYITFGGTVIPVWIGDVVGLGAGGSFGLKRNGASDGIGLSRSPAELWFEALLRVSPRLFVELAGGMHKDLNISMEWSGSNQEWQSSWGRVFDLGLYTISSKHVAWGFGIRRVDLEYKRYGTTFDAGSMGLEFRLHINP